MDVFSIFMDEIGRLTKVAVLASPVQNTSAVVQKRIDTARGGLQTLGKKIADFKASRKAPPVPSTTPPGPTWAEQMVGKVRSAASGVKKSVKGAASKAYNVVAESGRGKPDPTTFLSKHRAAPKEAIKPAPAPAPAPAPQPAPQPAPAPAPQPAPQPAPAPVLDASKSKAVSQEKMKKIVNKVRGKKGKEAAKGKDYFPTFRAIGRGLKGAAIGGGIGLTAGGLYAASQGVRGFREGSEENR